MRKEPEIKLATTTDSIEQAEFALGNRAKPPESAAYTVEQEIIREEEQKVFLQAAQNEFLEEAGDFQEYKKRRNWMQSPDAIGQPRIPLDEMSMVDYNKMRDKETGGRR